jgi:hypothetical protein
VEHLVGCTKRYLGGAADPLDDLDTANLAALRLDQQHQTGRGQHPARTQVEQDFLAVWRGTVRGVTVVRQDNVERRSAGQRSGVRTGALASSACYSWVGGTGSLLRLAFCSHDPAVAGS